MGSVGEGVLRQIGIAVTTPWIGILAEIWSGGLRRDFVSLIHPAAEMLPVYIVALT